MTMIGSPYYFFRGSTGWILGSINSFACAAKPPLPPCTNLSIMTIAGYDFGALLCKCTLRF